MDLAATANAAAPVLCVDTCAVLDLMRDPTRETALPHVRQAGFDLIQIAEQGGLSILCAEQVTLEFAENVDAVHEEARQSLKKLRENLSRIDALAAIYGAQGAAVIDHLDDHMLRAKALVDRWLTRATTVRPPDEILSKALARVNAARAPAKKGKESFKDCVVFETYLDAAQRLRAAGFRSSIVFVSSNPREYFEPGTSVLKAEIAADLAPGVVDFAVSMAHAKNTLGL